MAEPVSDLDIRFERVGQGYKAVVIDSPAGEGYEADFQSPFSDLELQNFALRMQRSGGMRRIESPQAAEAKQRGERLFKSLFHDDLLSCLQQSLPVVHAGGALRIRLRLGATPELANLPWEYLYDRPRNRFLCLWDRTPIVRYAEVSEPARPLHVSGPLRMLVLVSSPTDYPRLDVDGEWAKLNDAVADLVAGGRITLERLEDATLASVRRYLRRNQYHVFHFIGHGGFDPNQKEGVLVFTASDGSGKWVSGERLGIDLGNAPSLRLAVLNACDGARSDAVDPFSGVAQSLVQQGVPAVVAMQYEISDSAAVSFASGFYSAVADGLSIETSMSQARRDIHDISDLEWATPVLYLRGAVGSLFEVAPVSEPPPPPVDDDADASSDSESRPVPASPETDALDALHREAAERAAADHDGQATGTGGHESAPEPTRGHRAPGRVSRIATLPLVVGPVLVVLGLSSRFWEAGGSWVMLSSDGKQSARFVAFSVLVVGVACLLLLRGGAPAAGACLLAGMAVPALVQLLSLLAHLDVTGVRMVDQVGPGYELIVTGLALVCLGATIAIVSGRGQLGLHRSVTAGRAVAIVGLSALALPLLISWGPLNLVGDGFNVLVVVVVGLVALIWSFPPYSSTGATTARLRTKWAATVLLFAVSAGFYVAGTKPYGMDGGAGLPVESASAAACVIGAAIVVILAVQLRPPAAGAAVALGFLLGTGTLNLANILSPDRDGGARMLLGAMLLVCAFGALVSWRVRRGAGSVLQPSESAASR